MPLNDLSLRELIDMSDQLRALRAAGETLTAMQVEPRFDLTPGVPASIMTDVVVPHIGPSAMETAIAVAEAGTALAAAPVRSDWRNDPEGDEAWIAGNNHVLDRLCKVLKVDPGSVDWDGSDGSLNEETDALLRRICMAVTAEDDPTPSPEAAPDAPGEVAQPEPAPAPEETPPAVEGQAGGSYSHDPEDEIDERAFSSAAPSRPEGAIPTPAGAVADSGGGGDVAAAPEAPAAPGTHQRGFQAGPSWTAEEDEKLIATLVNLVRLGETKKAAIAIAARDLGRPEAGTAFRCHHKLKARIDAALTAAAMAQAQTEIPSPKAARQDESPAAEVLAEASVPHSGEPPASEPEPDAGGHDMEPGQREAETAVRAAASIEGQLADAADLNAKSSAPARASSITDPVTAHLLALTNKGGWTLERDLELMELSVAGWQPNEIALQLQMQSSAIKPRFDTLTGLYQDEATGKKLRRFTREDVFAALSRLSGKAA